MASNEAGSSGMPDVGENGNIHYERTHVNRPRDPPGQHSVNILPGDTKREIYRLSTFIKYPQNSPVNVAQLAASGFYYTGDRDRVKCFSCGLCVEDWVAGDDVKSPRWHTADCRFMLGQDCGNQLIGGLNRNIRRPSGVSGVGEPVRHSVSLQNTGVDREGFAASPASDDMPAQTALVNKVFSEDELGTQHPSSDMPDQTADIVDPRSVETRNIASAMPFHGTGIQDPPDPSQNERRNLQIFPCRSPVNPHMRNERMRLETFNHQFQSNVRATPRQIAKAGFYYLGDRDRVKCWYCNGGLQNWEPYDDAWYEHAKWFPTCEFLLQQKGPDFVQSIVSRYPNLPRPSIRDKPVPPTSFPVRNPRVIDHKTEALTHEEQINQYMLGDIVQTVIEMGFETSMIRHVVARRLGSGGNFYISVEELINDLSSYDEPNCDDENIDLTNIPGTSQGVQIENGNNESFDTNITSSMEARVRELQEERKCKMCRDNVASIVLLPCGHLCVCTQCAVALQKCPICRCKIDSCLKSF